MEGKFNERFSKIASENGPSAERLAQLKIELEAFQRNRDRHPDDAGRIRAVEDEIRALGGKIPPVPPA